MERGPEAATRAASGLRLALAPLRWLCSGGCGAAGHEVEDPRGAPFAVVPLARAKPQQGAEPAHNNNAGSLHCPAGGNSKMLLAADGHASVAPPGAASVDSKALLTHINPLFPEPSGTSAQFAVAEPSPDDLCGWMRVAVEDDGGTRWPGLVDPNAARSPQLRGLNAPPLASGLTAGSQTHLAWFATGLSPAGSHTGPHEGLAGAHSLMTSMPSGSAGAAGATAGARAGVPPLFASLNALPPAGDASGCLAQQLHRAAHERERDGPGSPPSLRVPRTCPAPLNIYSAAVAPSTGSTFRPASSFTQHNALASDTGSSPDASPQQHHHPQQPVRSRQHSLRSQQGPRRAWSHIPAPAPPAHASPPLPPQPRRAPAGARGGRSDPAPPPPPPLPHNGRAGGPAPLRLPGAEPGGGGGGGNARVTEHEEMQRELILLMMGLATPSEQGDEDGDALAAMPPGAPLAPLPDRARASASLDGAAPRASPAAGAAGGQWRPEPRGSRQRVTFSGCAAAPPLLHSSTGFGLEEQEEEEQGMWQPEEGGQEALRAALATEPYVRRSPYGRSATAGALPAPRTVEEAWARVMARKHAAPAAVAPRPAASPRGGGALLSARSGAAARSGSSGGGGGGGGGSPGPSALRAHSDVVALTSGYGSPACLAHGGIRQGGLPSASSYYSSRHSSYSGAAPDRPRAPSVLRAGSRDAAALLRAASPPLQPAAAADAAAAADGGDRPSNSGAAGGGLQLLLDIRQRRRNKALPVRSDSLVNILPPGQAPQAQQQQPQQQRQQRLQLLRRTVTSGGGGGGVALALAGGSRGGGLTALPSSHAGQPSAVAPSAPLALPTREEQEEQGEAEEEEERRSGWRSSAGAAPPACERAAAAAAPVLPDTGARRTSRPSSGALPQRATPWAADVPPAPLTTPAGAAHDAAGATSEQATYAAAGSSSHACVSTIMTTANSSTKTKTVDGSGDGRGSNTAADVADFGPRHSRQPSAGGSSSACASQHAYFGLTDTLPATSDASVPLEPPHASRAPHPAGHAAAALFSPSFTDVGGSAGEYQARAGSSLREQHSNPGTHGNLPRASAVAAAAARDRPSLSSYSSSAWPPPASRPASATPASHPPAPPGGHASGFAGPAAAAGRPGAPLHAPPLGAPPRPHSALAGKADPEDVAALQALLARTRQRIHEAQQQSAAAPAGTPQAPGGRGGARAGRRAGSGELRGVGGVGSWGG